MKNLNKVLLVASLLAIVVLPGVLANNVGMDITPNIGTEKFAPLVWMCNDRLVLDDNTEPGRVSGPGSPMFERKNNYAFEGEKIIWKVLVMDKNGIEKIKDVFITLGSSQGAGNSIEANCRLDHVLTADESVDSSCNARILEQQLSTIGYNNVAAYYTCELTVESANSMYGEYWATVEAQDLDDLSGTMAENEYWFFNPVISLDINGALSFDNVRPGTTAYSSTLTIGNNADSGSGVLLDMFISGTDFYDTSSSGAKCPTSNQLSLSAFRYFATSGAYSTRTDLGIGRGARVKDNEGYVGIGYGTGFNTPTPFYNGYEILQGAPADSYGLYPGNTLTPGAKMSLTFKLNLPEPCNGNFDSGKIYFWGEAV